LEGLLKTLVYDGGCPFCKAFALRSELKGGIPDLLIRDGRVENGLRNDLRRRGFNLSDGAVLIDGDQIWHGSEAISILCSELKPSDPLLALLNGLFRNSKRARFFYPGLLAARQLALTLKGLPVDPDRA
jgi:predicted DCC family thiol-disulfide oxidoreductase YuxK